MVKIIGAASDIITMITSLGAAIDQNNIGFDPLLLNIEKNKVTTQRPNIDHTGFMDGEFDIKTSGKGEMVIDVRSTLPRLKKFFGGGKVTLDYDAKEGRLIISSDKMRSIHYPPAITDNDDARRELPFKKTSKGILKMCGDPDNPTTPKTKVIMDASDLQLLLTQAKEVDVDYYQLSFKTKGKSEAWIGDESDKTKNPINTILDCVVTGKDAELAYGAGFPEIVAVLNGKIELYASTGEPVWIVQKIKEGKIKGRVEYIIAPRIDEE